MKPTRPIDLGEWRVAISPEPWRILEDLGGRCGLWVTLKNPRGMPCFFWGPMPSQTASQDCGKWRLARQSWLGTKPRDVSWKALESDFTATSIGQIEIYRLRQSVENMQANSLAHLRYRRISLWLMKCRWATFPCSAPRSSRTCHTPTAWKPQHRAWPLSMSTPVKSRKRRNDSIGLIWIDHV